MVEWKTVYEGHINHNANKGCHTSHIELHTHIRVHTWGFFMVEINLLFSKGTVHVLFSSNSVLREAVNTPILLKPCTEPDKLV